LGNWKEGMKGHLPIEIATTANVEVEQSFTEMFDALAEALADQFISQARSEVAAKLGVDENILHRKPDQINLDETIGMLK
jgi:hypothetical protein